MNRENSSCLENMGRDRMVHVWEGWPLGREDGPCIDRVVYGQRGWSLHREDGPGADKIG